MRVFPKRKMLAALAAVSLSFLSFSAHALATDDNTLIEGAKLCTQYLPRHERQYGIPMHLLAAIASTESGRFHKALGLNLPWPWTINVEGKGYFFDSKEEAVNAVRNFQARGYQSIDVGCMQVNLYHHPNAFATLEQAFDPAYNVAYAAQFLKQNFQDEGSWRKATADYHSHTPLFGEQYARLVYNSWNRIINKVADAKAGRPLMVATATPPVTSGFPNNAHVHVQPHITYHSPHMHEISVSNDTTRERGVLVIRPHYDEPATMQQASLDEQFVSQKKLLETVAGTSQAAPVAAVAAEPENKGAQIVKIQDGHAVKGQFEPSAHITRVSDSSDSKSSHNAFVFDN